MLFRSCALYSLAATLQTFESISAQDNKEVKGLRFCIYNAFVFDNSSTDLVDEDITFRLRFLNDFIDEHRQ